VSIAARASSGVFVVHDGNVAALEVRTRRHDARPHERTVRDLAPPGQDLLPVPGQVAHAGDTVCDVEGEHLPTTWKDGVHVHVPETGNHEPPRPGDEPRTGGNLDGVPGADRPDTVALDKDSLVRPGRRIGRVDDGDVDQGGCLLGNSGRRPSQAHGNRQDPAQEHQVHGIKLHVGAGMAVWDGRLNRLAGKGTPGSFEP
jgi:hypothetical protein